MTEENQPGAAPPLLLCPSQGHCVRAGALSGCRGSVSLRQELVVVGSGRQGAACRHTAHLRISSSLEHFRFFHPVFCTSHSSIDDIAARRDMTGHASGTMQMTALCYQLNFSGIFLFSCLVLFFFLQPPNTRSLFSSKSADFSAAKVQQTHSRKCWEVKWIKRQLSKCSCWPGEMPWVQWL